MKHIVLAGVVGKDAVLRRTQAGEPILGFSVAVDDGYGENKSTMWFDIALWGKRGQSLEPHLKKGTKVTVSGEFGQRQHENKTYFTCRASDIAIQGGGEKAGRQTMTADNGEVYDRSDVMAHVKSSKRDERDSYGNRTADVLNDDLPF